MTEQEKPGDQQAEEKSLVIRSETNLEGLSKDSLLQRLGFSPRLPQLFQQLNDALIKVAPRHLGTEIEMIPGKISVIETRMRHATNEGYVVRMRSVEGRNSLSVSTDDFIPAFTLTLEEVRHFIKETFPGIEAFLKVEPFGQGQDIDWEKLNDVTEEFLQPYVETPLRFVSEERGLRKNISVEDPPAEIMIDVPGLLRPTLKLVADRPESRNRGRAILGLGEFFYEGKPQDVETKLEQITQLFSNSL